MICTQKERRIVGEYVRYGGRAGGVTLGGLSAVGAFCYEDV